MTKHKANVADRGLYHCGFRRAYAYDIHLQRDLHISRWSLGFLLTNAKWTRRLSKPEQQLVLRLGLTCYNPDAYIRSPGHNGLTPDVMDIYYR
jgi:hypothetical protein